MLRRPKNRRKPGPKRRWLPSLNWRALGTTLATLTASTHGSAWIARRTASRFTERSPVPCSSIFTARSMSAGETR